MYKSSILFVVMTLLTLSVVSACADFTGDMKINMDDYNAFAGAYGTDNPFYDLDGNGFVGMGDFSLLSAEMNKATVCQKDRLSIWAEGSELSVNEDNSYTNEKSWLQSNMRLKNGELKGNTGFWVQARNSEGKRVRIAFRGDPIEISEEYAEITVKNEGWGIYWEQGSFPRIRTDMELEYTFNPYTEVMNVKGTDGTDNFEVNDLDVYRVV